jgi:hypothetical protein
MKYYRFDEYDEHGGHHVRISEEDIIARHMGYFASEMKKVGKEDQITKEACIQDFLIINFGWEETEREKYEYFGHRRNAYSGILEEQT